MGNNLTDDKDLVIKIGGHQAGGTKGQLIMNDIEFEGNQDRSEYAGIGNEETQGHADGNRTYTLSGEQVLNGESASLAKSLDDDEILTGVVRSPNMTANIGTMPWNSFTLSATDGSDAVTLSIDFTAYNVDIN